MKNEDWDVDLDQLSRRCDRCTLRDLCVPAAVPPEELPLLEARVRKTPTMEARTYLYRAGDPATALYAVRLGSFKSVRITRGGEEHILALHIRGDVLGMDGLARGHHSTDAVALETSAVCVVPLDQIESELKLLPGFCASLMSMMGQCMVEQQTQQMFMESTSAEERLARFLLRYSERLEARHVVGESFSLPLSRQELANYLGLQLATVSRGFGKLRDKGVIEVDRRLISILDSNALHDAANLSHQETAGPG